jgi:hypothetical protein
LLLTVTVAQAQDQDEALALEVIAEINEWRIDEGVWPLKPNSTLEQMAVDQAAYLVSLPDLPSDFHAGPTGLQPRSRAPIAPYNWPHYELTTQIAIGENAGVGTVASAMRFWRGSTLHTSTTLNTDYREIGVAALPYERNQHVFIVVFGSRPDVLPALVDPTDNSTIYLSNEMFRYASFFDSIQEVTELTLFDADGRPLSDEPQDWTETITIPEAAGDEVFILASDGEHQILNAVDLNTDQAITPGHIPSIIADAVTEQQPEIEATPEEVKPTSLPIEPTVVAAEVEPTAVPVEPTLVLVPTTVPAAEPDLLILYNNDTLDVMNISGAPLDWSALSFEGAISFPFTQWSRVTEIPLTAIPVNHCTQIRSVTVAGGVVVPDGCRWVRSLIQINADRLFWTQGTFDVRLNGNTLVTCQPGAGVCEVDLP